MHKEKMMSRLNHLNLLEIRLGKPMGAENNLMSKLDIGFGIESLKFDK